MSISVSLPRGRQALIALDERKILRDQFRDERVSSELSIVPIDLYTESFQHYLRTK